MAANDRPISTVLEDIVGNVQGIIRSEVRLAKTEIVEETAKAGKAAEILAIGAVLALYALGFMLLAGLYALEIKLAPWLSALIVTFVVGTVAAILVGVGIKRIKQVHPKPDKTIHTIKENFEWAKHRAK